jgi:hypothetical protein
MRKHFVAAASIAALAGLFVSVAAQAETDAAVLPPAPPPSESLPLKLSMSYDGRVLVKILEIQIDEEAGPKAYSAKAHLRTYGILALFRKINLHAASVGRVVGDKVLPIAFFHHNTDGKRERKVKTAWARNDVTTVSQPAFDFLGDPAATKSQKLEAIDPLSQIVHIALKAAPGAGNPCAESGRFFDGKQRYDVDFIAEGPSPLDEREKKLGLTRAIKCRMHYRPVAGFKKKSSEERKEGLKKDVVAELARVGEDGPWVISSMKADTKFGQATLSLTRLSVVGKLDEVEPSPGAVVATN